MLVGGAAFLLATVAGGGHFWWVFAALVLAGAAVYTPCGPLWAMIAEMVPRNVVGESMALVNSAGAVGGFVGGWAVGFLNGRFHANGPGFMFMSGPLISAAILTMLVRSGSANTTKKFA
jgi:MFS family permease